MVFFIRRERVNIFVTGRRVTVGRRRRRRRGHSRGILLLFLAAPIRRRRRPSHLQLHIHTRYSMPCLCHISMHTVYASYFRRRRRPCAPCRLHYTVPFGRHQLLARQVRPGEGAPGGDGRARILLHRHAYAHQLQQHQRTVSGNCVLVQCAR